MAKHQPSTPEQQSVRVLKVGERVRHILSELLARGEAHDDVLRAHNIAVTEVRMTTANDDVPEAPRHCQEDMELVAPIE